MDRTSALAAVVVLAMTLPAEAPSSAQPASQQYPHQLTAAEVRSRLSDETFYLLGSYGPKTFVYYFAANGQIKTRAPGTTDTGTWRITDDGQWCTKYATARNGQEACYTTWQTGPDSFENHASSGQVVKPTARAAGNPEGL
jgi:hypothetical protein